MRPRDAALATLVAVIWGANFIAIDRGLQDFPPLLFVALRFLFVCVPAVFLVPRPQAPWHEVAVLGLFMSAAQFALVYLAMHLGMPAGLTPLVLQSQVLFTLLFASVALRERPTRGQLVGVLVGAAGLATVAVGRAAHAPLVPVLLVVAAASAWAVGNVLARRMGSRGRGGSGLSMVVWSGTVVPLPLLGLSWAVEGGTPSSPRSPAPTPWRWAAPSSPPTSPRCWATGCGTACCPATRRARSCRSPCSCRWSAW